MWRGARCTHTNKPEVKCPTGGASGTAYSCSVGWQRGENYSVTVCPYGHCNDSLCCNRLHQYLSLRICEPGARLNIVAFLPLIFVFVFSKRADGFVIQPDHSCGNLDGCYCQKFQCPAQQGWIPLPSGGWDDIWCQSGVCYNSTCCKRIHP